MEAVAEVSERVSISTYGHTYENRPLLLLTVTSPQNHQNIENLRQEHLRLSDPAQSSDLDISSMPVVVWMGYSVHGNEASGSNASLLALYYLAAAQGPEMDNLLNNSVILIDPSINPDRLSRFASWANSNAGKVPVADPVTRQHVQSWPKARTNHYWFDLNRDWLPLVHPSSRARIAEYHRWLPHVLTDHHEQTVAPGFFFQPGVPSRQIR